MGKETVIDKVRLDFNSLGLNSSDIHQGTLAYSAVADVVSFAQRREDIFWDDLSQTASYLDLAMGIIVNSDPNKLTSERMKILNQNVSECLSKKGNDAEYYRVFSSLYDWLSRGFWESGYTSGSKLRYVISEFGNITIDMDKCDSLPGVRH